MRPLAACESKDRDAATHGFLLNSNQSAFVLLASSSLPEEQLMGVASRSFGSLSPYGLQLSQDDVLVVGPEWFCERGGPTAPTHGRFVREEKLFYRYGPTHLNSHKQCSFAIL